MASLDHVHVAAVLPGVTTRASVPVLEVVAFLLDATAALGQPANQAFHKHRLLRAATTGAPHKGSRLVMNPAGARGAGVADVRNWSDDLPTPKPRSNPRMRQATAPLAQHSLLLLPAAAALRVTAEVAGDHQHASPPAAALAPPASGLPEAGTASEHGEPSVPLPSPVP